MEGRLEAGRRLNDEVQAIGRNANSDNAAMLVQSQRLYMLLEAGQTEEALILCEREFRPARFPAAWPWMTKLLAGAGPDHRGERVAGPAGGRRLRRHP